MNSVFEVFQATAARRPDAPFLCVPARAQRDYCPEGAEFAYQWMLDQALAAARALVDQKDLSAEDIARKALQIGRAHV